MLKFSCVYRSYAGYLCVSQDDLYFASPRLRMCIGWPNVKQAHQDTKTIKDVPRSVLVIKLWRAHTVYVEGDERELDTLRSASRSCVFYAFQDLLGAKEHFMAMWKAYKEREAAAAAEAKKEREAHDATSGGGGGGSSAAAASGGGGDGGGDGEAGQPCKKVDAGEAHNDNDDAEAGPATTTATATRGVGDVYGADATLSHRSTTEAATRQDGSRRVGSRYHTSSSSNNNSSGSHNAVGGGYARRSPASTYTTTLSLSRSGHVRRDGRHGHRHHNDKEQSSSSLEQSAYNVNGSGDRAAAAASRHRHRNDNDDNSSGIGSSGSSSSSSSSADGSAHHRRRHCHHTRHGHHHHNKNERHRDRHATCAHTPVLQCVAQHMCTGVQWLLHELLYGRLGGVLVSAMLLVWLLVFASHVWRNAGVDRYLGGGGDGVIVGSSGHSEWRLRDTLASMTRSSRGDSRRGAAAAAHVGPLRETDTLLRLLALARGECAAVVQRGATLVTLQHQSAAAVAAATAARKCGVPGSSRAWTDALQHAVVELVHNYVALQTKMTALRGRYSERVRATGAQSPVPLSRSSSSRHGNDDEDEEQQQRERRWRLLPRHDDTSDNKSSSARHTGTAARRGIHTSSARNTHDEHHHADDDEDEAVAEDAMSASVAAVYAQYTARQQTRRRTSTLHRLVDDAAALRERVRRVVAFVRPTRQPLSLTRYYAQRRRTTATPATTTATRQRRRHAERIVPPPPPPLSTSSRVLPWRRERWVLYEEALSPHHRVVEYVTESEARQRHECVRLSQQLVGVAELLDRVFAEFTQTFLLDVYSSLARGVQRPSQWSRGPSALSTSATRTHARPPSPEVLVLRAALLRRYATALLRIDAREADEQQRRLEALTYTRALADVAEREAALLQLQQQQQQQQEQQSHHTDRSTRPMTSSSSSRRAYALRKAQLLDAFDRIVVQRRYSRRRPRARDTTAGATQNNKHADKDNKDDDGDAVAAAAAAAAARRWSRAAHTLRSAARVDADGAADVHTRTQHDMLRNVLEEVRFWQRHGNLWADHVYAQARDKPAELPQQRQAQQQQQHNEYDDADDVVVGARMRWEGLPVFRGLLCYTPRPQLRVASAADAHASCGGADGDEQQPSSSSSCTVWAAELQRRRDEQTRLAAHGDALTSSDVRAVETLWATELKMFALVVDEMASDGDNVTRARAYSVGKEELLLQQRQQPLQQQQSLSPQLLLRIDAARAVRHRLVHILRRVHVLYLMPFYAAGGSGVLDAVRYVLWPPLWWRRLWRSAAEEALDRVAFREMGLRNPAVQAVTAQVLDVAWGGLVDAPLRVLNSVLLQPPELLTLRASTHSAVVYALVLLVVVLASMSLVYALT